MVKRTVFMFPPDAYRMLLFFLANSWTVRESFAVAVC
jgi:hypothetical protein